MGLLQLVDSCPVSASRRAVFICRSHDGNAYMNFEVGRDEVGASDVFITTSPAVFRSMMQAFCQVGTTINVVRNGINHSYEFGV